MHHAIARFLIGLQKPQNALAADLTAGNAPNRSQPPRFLLSRDPDAHRGRNLRRGNHAPGHGLAMQKMTVAGRRFQRMADGVAEIQHAAQPAFALVRRYHLGLQPHRFRNHPFQGFGVPAQL